MTVKYKYTHTNPGNTSTALYLLLQYREQKHLNTQPQTKILFGQHISPFVSSLYKCQYSIHVRYKISTNTDINSHQKCKE